MSILLRCASTTCEHHIVLGAILDDGTFRQLIRGNKVVVSRGEVTVGHRDCGYQRKLIIPAPLEDFRL